MKAFFTALNVIYDTEESRSFFRSTAITLLFTVGTLVSLTVTMVLVVAAPTLLALSGLSGSHLWGLALLRWPVLFAGVAVSLALLYRYAPNHQPEPWPTVTFGGMLAATLIVVSAGVLLVHRSLRQPRGHLQLVEHRDRLHAVALGELLDRPHLRGTGFLHRG